MGKEDEDQTALRHELAEIAGPRSEAMQLVRDGLPDTPEFRKFTQLQRDAARYRMGTALMWGKEKMLRETGWTVDRLKRVEKHVLDEEVKNWGSKRNENIYAEYRLRMEIVGQEMANVMSTFRQTRQYDKMLQALRGQAEVLDKIIKTGLELGVIDRPSKKIEVSGKVETQSLSLVEIRARIVDELRSTQELLETDPRIVEIEGPVGAVFRNLLPEPEEEQVPEVPKKKVAKRVPKPKAQATTKTSRSSKT